MLFLCLIVGLVVGMVLVFTSSHFVGLLTGSNKSLYAFINGTADYFGLFWKRFLSFLVPTILIFVVTLNYFLGFVGYLFITYQSALFVLSCSAVIKTYALSGFLNVLFIMIPINVIYFGVLFYLVVVCMKRAKLASRYKSFAYGFDGVFFSKISICVGVLLFVSFFACIIYPIFLRNTIFLIF